MELSTTPHNDFFAQVMRRKELAHHLFSRNLPEDIGAQADLSQLELTEGKHISDQGVTLYNDLLYRCPLTRKGQMAYFLLMAEHQRNPYKHMHLRLLGYDLGAKEDCARQAYSHMPIVVHFVLYNGTKPWPYSTHFADYYADPALGAKYLSMAPFILIDIATYLPEKIAQDSELGFCFAAFKATTTPDPIGTFAQLMNVPTFERHVRGLSSDLKNIVTRYLAHFVDQQQQGLEDVVELVSTNTQEKQSIMTSVAQAYQQQGMQQGMQQGIQTVARTMLSDKTPPEQVSKWTGLSKEELAKLTK